MAGKVNLDRPRPRRLVEAQKKFNEVLKHNTPSCNGIDEFTETRDIPLNRAERILLYKICFDCPIYAECHEYAQETRPTAGYWAGRSYGSTSGL